MLKGRAKVVTGQGNIFGDVELDADTGKGNFKTDYAIVPNGTHKLLVTTDTRQAGMSPLGDFTFTAKGITAGWSMHQIKKA